MTGVPCTKTTLGSGGGLKRVTESKRSVVNNERSLNVINFVIFFQGPTGGRVSFFQTTLPNIGPGELKRREEPNQKSNPKVQY